MGLSQLKASRSTEMHQRVLPAAGLSAKPSQTPGACTCYPIWGKPEAEREWSDRFQGQNTKLSHQLEFGAKSINKKFNTGAPGWLSGLSVCLWLTSWSQSPESGFLLNEESASSAQVMIPGSWDRAPCQASCSMRSLLLPLPLPAAPLAYVLSLSLPSSLSNKQTKSLKQ